LRREQRPAIESESQRERQLPRKREREEQRETVARVRELPNKQRSLGPEAARQQGVLSGPDSVPERARITQGQELLRQMLEWLGGLVFIVEFLASEHRGSVLPCVARRGVCHLAPKLAKGSVRLIPCIARVRRLHFRGNW